MGIDGIGKAGGASGPAGTQAPTAASEKGTFAVGTSRAAAAGQSGAPEAAAASPAERVRAGQMNLQEYLGLRVDEATRHLEGKLGPNDLDSVRGLLRSQIAQDPAVRELVKAATGAMPPDGE